MQYLKKMINSFSESISLLNRSRYEDQSIYLLLIFIDQLGWLASPNEHSTGADFKNWLNTYCDLSKLRCSSQDLWNTRCSFVHMGTAENMRFDSSRNFRLAFYQNISLSEQAILKEEANYPAPTRLVNLVELFNCINDGIDKFLETIENDSNLEKLVLEKSELRNRSFSSLPL